MNRNKVTGDKNITVAGGKNNNIVQQREKQDMPVSPLRLLLTIALFALGFFLFFLVLKERFCFSVSNDSLVITFIGIIATFIVVSNYLQVKRAEDKAEEANTRVNRAIMDIGSLKEEVKALQLENAKLKGRLFQINPKGFLHRRT